MSEPELPGRTTPHNLDAERALLGSLLLDPERIVECVELVRADDFFDKRHRAVFEVLVGLSERNVPIEPVTVSQALLAQNKLHEIGGVELLVELMAKVTSSAHLPYYGRIVSENAVLRGLVSEATDIIARATATAPDGEAVQKLLDESEQRIYKLARERSGGGAEPIQGALEEVFRRIDARAHRGEGLTGLPTTFYDLDELLCGLNAGDLIVVAARPSMGKTAFALNLIEKTAMAEADCLQGRRPAVLLFSLEMGRLSLLERMLCSHARVEAHRLRSGRLAPEERSSLIDAAEALKHCRIYFDDSPGLSMMSLRSRARRLKSKQGLDLIVVDYLQLLSFPRSESRQQEISNISRSLKELARELEIPVVALAQLSRQVELRDPPRPQLSDLRESGSIEQDADVVLMLYRPEYYPKHQTDENKGLAEVICAKHRNGPTGIVRLQFFQSMMRFENRAPTAMETIAP